MTLLKYIKYSVIIFLFFSSKSINAQIPTTFTIDGQRLFQSKVKYNNQNVLYFNAVNELLSRADQILTHKTYSIVYKSYIPLGASKHDYVSLSTYYWPDTTKANGLPYIPKDGLPFKGRDIILDYKILNNMANDVLTLGLAYYFSGNEDYAKHSRSLIKCFFFDRKTKMNPKFEYSQVVLGRPNSGGATISATSLISLIEGIQLIKNSKHWKEFDQKRIALWVKEFLNWMLNSKKGIRESKSPNNIGTYYTLQTTVYALFVGDSKLAKNIIEHQAYKRIDSQINGKGEMVLELKRANPWGYLVYNLAAFDKLVLVASHVNVDLLYYQGSGGGSIEKAYSWLFPYFRGDYIWNYSDKKVSKSAISQVLWRSRSQNFSEILGSSIVIDPRNYKFILY